MPAIAQSAPTVLLVAPLTGSSSGGTAVTITGIGFTGATAVEFGGTPATGITVVNDLTITATAPAHAAGLVGVSVTTPSGTGSGLGLFTYLPPPAPTVVLVAPLTGSTAGGTAVTITGLNFTGATAVEFGGVPATGVTVVNDLTITATAPAHAAGIVGVSVTTPAGTGSGLGLFTYLPAPPTVLLVAPLTGSTAGGTAVTITGLNFTGATAVEFGGVPATGVTVVNDLTITATAPAHAAGIVGVSVTTPAGTGSGLGLFTYLPPPAPTVVLVAPLTGSTAGGTAVTITGLNFTGATAVEFGGVPATGITVVNDLTITATAPAHAAGLVGVSVTTPAGTGSGLGLFTYLPLPAPTVLLVAPLTGSTAGGTAVTITGLNFTGATAVEFGGVPATGITVVNDLTITATAPAHAAGIVGVSVTTPAGTGSGLGLFTYLPAPPTVLLVAPLTGSTTGGTAVTITGLNFTGATAVEFGGVPATGVTVVNDLTITATAPAHAAGIVGVSVTTPAGTGSGLGLFTYLPTPAPTVLLVAPLVGSTAGGTAVTITGLNFTGATAVEFGGVPATGVTVVNDLTITATAPAHAAGIVGVSVTTPAGTGSGLGLFTYLPAPPTVLLVAPLTGSTAGGTAVTITGLNFTGATAVEFGGVPATGVTVVNDLTITATAPAHAAGIVGVSVTTPAGTGSGIGLFTYLPTPAPTVLLVAPLVGSTAGGTAVTITGLNFTGATAVECGGVPATGITVVNDLTITATAPAHAAGIVGVSVTTPSGTGSGIGLFTYLPPPAPTVLLVAPLVGSTAGGTAVTITGLNFTGATDVSFGGTSATGITVVNDLTITATAPAHAAGIVGVSVTTPAGTGSGLGLFTYLPTPAPTVLLVAPLTGSTAGGTAVTITGVNFTGATDVSFGGTSATGVTVVNDSTITATAPAHAAGIVGVSVTTPAGTGGGIGLFTYLPTPAPTVLLVAPPTGSTAGGTAVTITGVDFTGATAVTFGGAAATGVTVVNATTISATAPAHAAGIVDVAVTTPSGTGNGPGLFTYLSTTDPTVLLVAPPTGSTDGGTAVTITGLNFTGATAVMFGDTAATGVTVVSSTTITVTTPAHAAGVVNVAITTPAGTAVGASLFTFVAPVRPDPTLDVEVLGLMNAQTTSAIRVAHVQMRNFHDRLEHLHNERERSAASMNIRVGLPSDRRQDQRRPGADKDGLPTGGPDTKPSTYGYGTSGGDPLAALLADSIRSDDDTFETAESSRLAFWSGGFVNFGERDDGGVDINHTTVGVSGGADYRFSDQVVAGIGFGFGRDRTDIGNNGTESRAKVFSAAVYGSYEPIDNFFIDGLLGGGTLNFDSKRYVAATGAMATGERSGSQVFGSVTAAYEIRKETGMISPYGRLAFSRSWLDQFTERGGGGYGLAYGDQSVDSVSGALGIRANTSFEMDWGVLTPGVRVEYTRDLDSSSQAKLGYAGLENLPYTIDARENDRDSATVGLSLEMKFENNRDLVFDYQATFSGDGDRSQTLGAQLKIRF